MLIIICNLSVIERPGFGMAFAYKGTMKGVISYIQNVKNLAFSDKYPQRIDTVMSLYIVY